MKVVCTKRSLATSTQKGNHFSIEAKMSTAGTVTRAHPAGVAQFSQGQSPPRNGETPSISFASFDSPAY